MATLATSPPVILGVSAITFLVEFYLQMNNLNLQDDNMCGITTGGSEECWWDCNPIRTRYPFVDVSIQFYGFYQN